jgi:hypothetical protein
MRGVQRDLISIPALLFSPEIFRFNEEVMNAKGYECLRPVHPNNHLSLSAFLLLSFFCNTYFYT